MYCLEPVGPASVSEGRLVSRRDGTSAPTNRSTPSRPCRRLDSRVPRHIKCGLGVQGTSRRRGLGAQGTSALLTLLCSPCSARSPLARVQAGPLFLVLFAFQEDERRRFSQSSVSSNFDGRTPPHVHSTHTHTLPIERVPRRQRANPGVPLDRLQSSSRSSESQDTASVRGGGRRIGGEEIVCLCLCNGSQAN